MKKSNYKNPLAEIIIFENADLILVSKDEEPDVDIPTTDEGDF